MRNISFIAAAAASLFVAPLALANTASQQTDIPSEEPLGDPVEQPAPTNPTPPNAPAPTPPVQSPDEDGEPADDAAPVDEASEL